MTAYTRVAIIGGGSLGVSLAYHLTKEGWTDVMVIEKGELTSGSTWHAAGLCSNFIGNMSVAKIHRASLQLYQEILPKETGEPSAFHTTGSLRIGFTELEEQWFRNLASRAKNVPCEFNIISKREAEQLNPLMDFSKARIIASTPDDGHVDPTSVVMPLAQLARANGATMNRFNRVIEINQLPSGEWQVVTEKGTIIAQHVVNAGGCFAPEVSAMVGVKLPIINLEHQYIVTDPHDAVKALDFELPVCRDSYTAAYIRQEGNGFLVGPYETFGSKPWALEGMNWSFDRELFAGDIDRLAPFLERSIELTPAFGEVGLRTVVNGPITHTPDDNMLAGPQAGLTNFWNCCGSSIGIAQGAVGKFLAQWMVYGQTEINMAPLDSRRFGNWADRDYCIAKAIESYEMMYTALGATEHRQCARAKRTSPLYAQLADEGAVHGVVQGYEKPLWFKTEAVPSETPNWSRGESHLAVAAECRAVQQSVGMIDISGAANYAIKGADASAFLDHLSSNKLPVKDGCMSLTLFHGANGGIMTEQSITRIDENYYYLTAAIGTELKDLQWMQSQVGNFDVSIENLTDKMAGVLITGPKSRQLLQRHTDADLSQAALPWLSAQKVPIDSADVLLLRVSYAGELGYELHMPRYQLFSIVESIKQSSIEVCPQGITNFGSLAFNSMRMEKAYRAWGHEFTEEISGVEAGMGRFIDTSRNFIGVDSIKQRLAKGTKIQLAYLAFDNDIPCEVFGNEAVYHSDQLVGLITSGAYGHRVGYSLAFAYVTPELVVQGTKLQIQTSLGVRNAQVEMSAVYDPTNELLRG